MKKSFELIFLALFITSLCLLVWFYFTANYRGEYAFGGTIILAGFGAVTLLFGMMTLVFHRWGRKTDIK
jgi:hypothetical protein